MIRHLTIAAALAVMGLCTYAYASPSAAPPPVVKRQMIACMTQQMSVSKTISYNDAARACKDVRKAPVAALAASNAAKPAIVR